MTTRYLLDKSAAYRAHLPAVRHRLEPLMERGLLARCGITDLEFGVSARSREDHRTLGTYRRDALEYVNTPDTVWVRAWEIQEALTDKGFHRSVKIPDLIIAAVAEHHGADLPHRVRLVAAGAKVSAVAETAPLRVQLIAKTDFLAPPDVPWTTDADGGPALVEFAGRACYQSWSKPNPKTATNAGYLRHIIDVGHFSVLEHASVSFYITGISRSCTHELIRHRHFSYSQLSQRYVPEKDSRVVVPPGMEDDADLRHILTEAADAARATYSELLAKLEAKFADQPNAILRRKQARQAARAVLPNATETRIVVTGNYRAWRHFIAMRASEHADVEIRRLAIECLRQLAAVAPAVFADFEVTTLADGTEVATSPLATEA